MADSKKQLDSGYERSYPWQESIVPDGNFGKAASDGFEHGTALWHPKDQCPANLDQSPLVVLIPFHTQIMQPGGIYYGQW